MIAVNDTVIERTLPRLPDDLNGSELPVADTLKKTQEPRGIGRPDPLKRSLALANSHLEQDLIKLKPAWALVNQAILAAEGNWAR
jgi:hypothetical protein